VVLLPLEACHQLSCIAHTTLSVATCLCSLLTSLRASIFEGSRIHVSMCVTQIMKGHKTLRSFDLTINPLGEAGARSIFRAILRGVTCWVLMVSAGGGVLAFV
jgi:hypothetical protein